MEETRIQNNESTVDGGYDKAILSIMISPPRALPIVRGPPPRFVMPDQTDSEVQTASQVSKPSCNRGKPGRPPKKKRGPKPNQLKIDDDKLICKACGVFLSLKASTIHDHILSRRHKEMSFRTFISSYTNLVNTSRHEVQSEKYYIFQTLINTIVLGHGMSIFKSEYKGSGLYFNPDNHMKLPCYSRLTNVYIPQVAELYKLRITEYCKNAKISLVKG
ncbi:hypothetical protein WA158_006057 [Blastocystis sp. Blastoise]